ncbi:cyclodeaminase/cyclohydrolase family protein [Desulforhopalus singaporensis]|uniref:Formiminotetrahydrofolate cyclodeaminase n=1 Tax=Desulforhopalus singaporensis TaxID=91360 RepID=A0A1H0UDT7_9BACT|nr:cyclodeaminase/cyclohydrolase family protein [Desulforhopalus singaporensis]SDP64301.1 formiminotetrahydrofolate cyclodeaminase [Desulforhopalus singaporensis]
MTQELQRNIDAFLKVLDANDFTTGGGTASCIAGSMAAGMVGMVAQLSRGKKDLLPAKVYEEMADQAKILQKQLFDGGAEDTLAFKKVSDAFNLPKFTDDEKAARSHAIQQGLEEAARVPMRNAQYCLAVHRLCIKLAEKYNTNCASDLYSAKMLAQTGIHGCLANVEINLPSIKDKDLVSELSGQVEEIKGKLNL